MAKPFVGIQFPTIPVNNKAHCKILILYLEYKNTKTIALCLKIINSSAS